MAPRIKVVDKTGNVIGSIEARIGLRTFAGVIRRVSEKSVWIVSMDNVLRLYRSSTGRIPSIPVHRVPKAERNRLGI